MWIEEIDEIRERYSKAKKGPWSDPVARPEMCKKTVLKLHAKSLPMSTDLDDLIRRDDELYEITDKGDKGDKEKEKTPRVSPKRGAAAELEHFGGDQGDASDPRPGDEVVIEHDEQQGSEQSEADPKAIIVEFTELLTKAEKIPPKNRDSFEGFVVMLIDTAKRVGGEAGATLLNNFWGGTLARNLRNKAGLVAEESDAFKTQIEAAIKEMSDGVVA
jgi:hypothetical protein